MTLLICFVSALWPYSYTTNITSDRTVFKEGHVEVILELMDYKNEMGNMKNAWGTGGPKPPKKVIKNFTVKHKGEGVLLPLSSYIDLTEPRILKLEVDKETYQIMIKGSDAGGSYIATMQFKKTLILRRKVISPSFPNQLWEETIYSFIDPESDM